jgi:hypothetical protein
MSVTSPMISKYMPPHTIRHRHKAQVDEPLGSVLISIHTMANPRTCGGLSLRATNGSMAISPFSPALLRDCFVPFAESILSEVEGLWVLAMTPQLMRLY